MIKILVVSVVWSRGVGGDCEMDLQHHVLHLQLAAHGSLCVAAKRAVTVAAPTQAIDRWQSLDRFLPKSLNKKVWKARGLNQSFRQYIHRLF